MGQYSIAGIIFIALIKTSLVYCTKFCVMPCDISASASVQFRTGYIKKSFMCVPKSFINIYNVSGRVPYVVLLSAYMNTDTNIRSDITGWDVQSQAVMHRK